MSHDSVVRLDSIGAEVRIDVHLDVGEARGARVASRADPSSALASTAPAGKPAHAGHIVGGRYELVRLLGQGSMGAVWLANHTTLGERVALKLMSPAVEADAVEDAPTSAARFRFEAQIAARLSRKTRHVVRVTDHGQEGPRPYLVMELLEGQTLEKAILCRGPMGLDEVAGLVTQIARGLEAAHSDGILHRDLKPANVFLADSGEGRPVVKLLDFGVARGVSSQRARAPFATAKGLIMGTPGYMSPEQAAATEIDVRSDLWSLAAIAYEALTCELPVAGGDSDSMLSNLRACRTEPVRKHRPDLPETVERFFQRAFAPRIEDRFATCADLAHGFLQAVQLGATPAVTRRLHPRALPHLPSPAIDLRRRTAARPRARLAVVAILACAGLVGASWYALLGPLVRRAAGRDASLAMPAGVGPSAAARSMPEARASQPASQEAASAPWMQPDGPPALPATAPKAPPRPSGELGEFKAYY